MSALLEVDGATKRFGALRAVDGVSFEVAPEEIFGIAGPNGSGKSTLFNIITKIPYAPDAGTIRLDGSDLGAASAHQIVRLGVARTFQKETRFESLDVRENVLIGAIYGDAAGGSGSAAVERALDLVGLPDEERGRPTAELSVYNTKLLMLATGLATSPRLLLLDEPASGLTQPEIARLKAVINRLRGSGLAMILIEHVLPLLLTVSDRVMVLNQGQVLTIEQPDTVVHNPAVIDAYLGRRRH